MSATKADSCGGLVSACHAESFGAEELPQCLQGFQGARRARGDRASGGAAKLLLDKDPELKTPRGQAVRTLLYLIERDEGVRLLRSG